MDQVGKFDGVLNEEYRDIVADEIPVPFFGVEFDGKSAHIARGIHGTRSARNRGDAGE